MTNAQKSLLRRIVQKEPHRTDKDIADDVECAIGTVKKYRKAFAK